MDLAQNYGVDFKRSISITGVTSLDSDADIIASLEKYGVVTRILRVPNAQPECGETVIAEFESEITMGDNESDFPLEIENVTNKNVKWQASRIGMPALHQTPEPDPVLSDSSDENVDSYSDHSTTPLIKTAKLKYDHRRPLTSQPVTHSAKSQTCRVVKPKTTPTKLPVVTDEVTNPPEIQRIVVEHVIRNDSVATHSQSKWLRSFSGRVPKPPGEVDFETWCLHVELMFSDGTPVDIQRRKILESLLPPASDVVKQLGYSAHPREYVRLLDSAYGLVEDGEEIFARFLNTNQNPGEKASDYLQRLQALLNTAVSRNGVIPADASRHLLKQFKRGCWDHNLVLQLELKKETTPEFAELLLELRTEEDRRASKLDRMQRQFGPTKTKPIAHMHSVPDFPHHTDPSASVLQAYISETESLKKQVAELQLQLMTKPSKKQRKRQVKAMEKTQEPPAPVIETLVHQIPPRTQVRAEPKAWFCFRCGEDGHIARNCENAINKAVVDQKYKELKARQEEWKAQQQGQALNWSRFR
ncbi:unnamed protein product [Oreochromis niloticus]|nr:unnamed protein product [Mustela putorius furo]